MKTKLILLLIVSSLFISCDFSKSVELDMLTGLSSKGDGLTVSDVYLTVNDGKVKRNTFTYGETFYINFNGVTGFKKEGGNDFPGMELAIVGEAGDTAMYYEDMYADKTEGVNINPLLLYANITVANPMTSNKKYTLYVNIWDKKGTGTFKSKFDFDIIPNENIVVENPNNIAYDNIYLFSKEDATLTDKLVKVNQKYYMIFEGLKGFKEEEGKVSVGLSMKATGADGEVLLNSKDLLGEGEWDPAIVEEQLSADFSFYSPEIKSPITCEFVVFDKKGDAKVNVKTNLELAK